MLTGTLYVGALLAGLAVGPFILRALVGALPARASKWQLHRALSMGDGWLVHQSGDRQYVLEHIGGDQETAEVRGEEIDLSNLGHISTKTGSVPMGVSYGPGAVEESSLVGIDEASHVSQRDAQTADSRAPAKFDDMADTWDLTGGDE